MGKHLRSTVLFVALLTVNAGVNFNTAEAIRLTDLMPAMGR